MTNIFEQEPKRKRMVWNAERDQLIKTRYPTEGARLLAAEFGCTPDSVQVRAAVLKIKCDRSLLLPTCDTPHVVAMKECLLDSNGTTVEDIVTYLGFHQETKVSISKKIRNNLYERARCGKVHTRFKLVNGFPAVRYFGSLEDADSWSKYASVKHIRADKEEDIKAQKTLNRQAAQARRRASKTTELSVGTDSAVSSGLLKIDSKRKSALTSVRTTADPREKSIVSAKITIVPDGLVVQVLPSSSLYGTAARLGLGSPPEVGLFSSKRIGEYLVSEEIEGRSK